jgi:hypothetical protein
MTETTIYETDDRAARRRVATFRRPEETLAVFATGRQAPDDDTLRVYRVVDLGSDSDGEWETAAALAQPGETLIGLH